MSKQQIEQTSKGKASDTLVLTVAIVIAIAGLLGFTFLTDQILTIRLAILIGSFLVAVGVAACSASGKRFLAFGRESYEELRRVVWPSRRETVNTTGIVMAFVCAIAFYLFAVDALIEWGLYDGLLRMTF